MRTWIEKQRNLIDFTLSSLLRRKGKNIALALIYTLVVFSLGSVLLFTQSMKREATLILRDTPEILVQKLVAGRHDLIPLSYAEKIARIRGVAGVRGRLWGYYYDPASGANFTFMVARDRKFDLEEIAVGSGISRTSSVSEGDMMTFIASDGEPINFLVKEVLPHESELVSSDLILVSEDDFRRLFGISGEYATDLVVEVANRKEITTVAGKIVQILPDARPIMRDEVLRTYDAVFQWRTGLAFMILTGAVLAFVVLAWDKATGLSAEERREIGILKGIGWETSDILVMKFWEGTVISLSSFFAGILLAYLHVFFASSTLFEPILKGWSVLYPEFKLTPFIDFYQMATLFFLTVIPYTVTTIVPSWRAATIDPDLVMR